MIVLPKHSAVLDCQAHGQPPVTIKWLKNGVRLTESAHIHFLSNGSLYIPKIKHTREDSDEGFYQCLSQNKFGAILSQRSRLTIASKYGPQHEISSVADVDTAGAIGLTQFNIVWDYTVVSIYRHQKGKSMG